jgi:hypothetical protein
MGNDGEDKIEMIIDELFGFPERTCYAGGYEFKGTLIIHAGCYHARSGNYYSTTGELHGLCTSLLSCYNSLAGSVKYPRMSYEKNLEFELKMTKLGHATIEGEFREYPHLLNTLVFQIETDQTCIQSAINDLTQIERLFGDNMGIKSIRKVNKH